MQVPVVTEMEIFTDSCISWLSVKMSGYYAIFLFYFIFLQHLYPLCSSEQSACLLKFKPTTSKSLSHCKKRVPERFQSSFSEEKIAESIFGERGVAAWWLLLME